ncbi:MAG: metalloregulator ArsR/SmtB family transcription factor [Acidobacteriia bacterium]|nr:metalloregulator ArsR/SmtB family transcription factor [Terriglobia bacterium]
MSSLLTVIAAPRRLEILRLVWDRERCAGEIHEAMPEVSFGAVSQHLRVLSTAGLVAQRAEGRFRYYLARKEDLGSLREWLETMWGDALARLKTRAELEEARRGPRPRMAGPRRALRKGGFQ